MRKFLVSTLISAAIASPLMAQEAQAVSPVPEDLAAPAASANQQKCVHAQQQPPEQQAVTAQLVEDGLRTRLAHAGFTDIEMIPTSFLVRAKDVDGNPVMLVLSPGSAAEFKQGAAQEDQDDGAPPAHRSMNRSSELIGSRTPALRGRPDRDFDVSGPMLGDRGS